MKNGAKRQTLFLTAVNAVVRALGLLLRVLLSRALGAEIMGVAELAQSVHMLAISPLTSGLPVAVSRMTAKATGENREKPLLAGVSLTRRFSALLIPGFLLLSPWIASVMGDMRTLPSLWFSAPCILILGYSAVFNGYCYGLQRSGVPALSELIEQVSRLGLCMLLLCALPKLTPPWLAAVPVASTMLAEIAGLVFVLAVTRVSIKNTGAAKAWRLPVMRLAAPTTLMRLTGTLLRSLEAILIPLRLRVSGLSAAESTARLGMLNGMVSPILMLPCVFTSALTMVMLPRLALAEEKPGELRRILGRCLFVCAAVAAASWLAIDRCAPLLSGLVYRMPELTELFQKSAPLSALFAFSHMATGVIAALGLQKRSMYGVVPISAATLLATWQLAADPAWRLTGVILVQGAGQAACILWNAAVLWRWKHQRSMGTR